MEEAVRIDPQSRITAAGVKVIGSTPAETPARYPAPERFKWSEGWKMIRNERPTFQCDNPHWPENATPNRTDPGQTQNVVKHLGDR